MLTYLLVFLFAVLVDVFYVIWIHCLNIGRPYLGGLAAVGISTCGVLNVIRIVDDHWLIAPYLIGAFVGVVVGFKLKERIK